MPSRLGVLPRRKVSPLSNFQTAGRAPLGASNLAYILPSRAIRAFHCRKLCHSLHGQEVKRIPPLFSAPSTDSEPSHTTEPSRPKAAILCLGLFLSFCLQALSLR